MEDDEFNKELCPNRGVHPEQPHKFRPSVMFKRWVLVWRCYYCGTRRIF